MNRSEQFLHSEPESNRAIDHETIDHYIDVCFAEMRASNELPTLPSEDALAQRI